MVEGARLESVYIPKGYRGFESRSLRVALKLNFNNYYILNFILMKKLLMLFALMATLFLSSATLNYTYAQDGEAEKTEEVKEAAAETKPAAAAPAADEPELTGTEWLKKQFIDGGWEFMTLVLICLIIGLAICIERIISLNLASTNSTRLLKKVSAKLDDNDLEGATELCKSSRGPIASIFYQGLSRADQGLDVVEKSIISYGSVQMGRLERGLVWISLFIALAPMLGFMGTVLGMIGAFDAIEAAGDISPSLVAGGIKVALLTTVFGLVVAIILQIFYNYLVSKVDGIVNDMEDASISLVDLISNYKNRRA